LDESGRRFTRDKRLFILRTGENRDRYSLLLPLDDSERELRLSDHYTVVPEYSSEADSDDEDSDTEYNRYGPLPGLPNLKREVTAQLHEQISNAFFDLDNIFMRIKKEELLKWGFEIIPKNPYSRGMTRQRLRQGVVLGAIQHKFLIMAFDPEIERLELKSVSMFIIIFCQMLLSKKQEFYLHISSLDAVSHVGRKVHGSSEGER
jgi:hypothetical protein